MKKGQMWSIDVIVGVIIFISIIAIFYTSLINSDDETEIAMEENADLIIRKLTQDPSVKVISDRNTLNISKLEQLANWSYSDYEGFKKQLGVQGDFCIYLEDENGRLVPIGNYTSLGKNDLNISNKQCGSRV